jgi:hypothetical protein
MSNGKKGYTAGWRKSLISEGRNTCGKCGDTLPLSYFYKKGSSYADGTPMYMNECIKCCRERNKTSWARNGKREQTQAPIIKTVDMLTETTDMTIDQAIEEYECRLATLRAAKALLNSR